MSHFQTEKLSINKATFKIPFYLVWQYIHRGRIWTLTLTIFLLAVAFVNLLFVSALFNGIITGSNEKLQDTISGDIYITPATGKKTISDITSVSGVTSASATTLIPGLLLYNSITSQGTLYAIKPSDDAKTRTLSSSISQGSWLSDDDTDGIIIGRQIAGGNGVENNAFSFKGAKVGDKVTLELSGVSHTFTVRGILYTKYIIADQMSFITQKALEKISPTYKNHSTANLVKTSSSNISDVIQKIKARNISSIDIHSWEDTAGVMKSVSNSFLSINTLMTGVVFLLRQLRFLSLFMSIFCINVGKLAFLKLLALNQVSSYQVMSLGVLCGCWYFTWDNTFLWRARPLLRHSPAIAPNL